VHDPVGGGDLDDVGPPRRVVDRRDIGFVGPLRGGLGPVETGDEFKRLVARRTETENGEN